jgi:4'-phosphopantetheinyl transferase
MTELAAYPLLLPQAPADVQAWRIDFDPDRPAPADAMRLLDASERSRMLRYARPQDRHRFAVTRATLKSLLAQAASIADPSAVRFTSSPHGRPQWPDGGLHFNAAHSGGVACIAISNERPVGIDVELRRDIDVELLADSVLTKHERDTMRRLPRNQQIDVFHDYWVRKEAALKALGVGIGELLQHISVVPLTAHSNMSGIACDPDTPHHDALQSLRLCGLDLPAAYAGALAWADQPGLVSARRRTNDPSSACGGTQITVLLME